jgi:hypothetical protein
LILRRPRFYSSNKETMNYEIKITKTENNPDYKDEMKSYSSAFNQRYDKPIPTPTIVRDVLICNLTEEQFKKVKAEVLKVFK